MRLKTTALPIGEAVVDRVVGTWRLETFEIEDLAGQKRPWGRNTHGLLIYSSTGHMSASINREIENRSENWHQNLFDSILFYSGTFSVEGDTITHSVTEASNPERIGKQMIRHATLVGDLLQLRSPKEKFGTAHLTWRRVSL